MEIRGKALGKILRGLEKQGHAEIVALMVYSNLKEFEVQGTKYAIDFEGGEYVVQITE